MYLEVLSQVVICVLIADFVTGLVHWLEDTYGVPSWPFIGQSVIVPNIDHHRNPSFIGSMSSFISRNYQPWFMALVFIVVMSFLGYTHWMVGLTAVLASFGNEIHTWNHSKTKNKAVKFLWDTGLIQSKKQHAMHHVPPYDRYFCTLTNFTNAVLELINFWRILEWTIATFLRIKPKRLSPERDGY